MRSAHSPCNRSVVASPRTILARNPLFSFITKPTIIPEEPTTLCNSTKPKCKTRQPTWSPRSGGQQPAPLASALGKELAGLTSEVTITLASAALTIVPVAGVGSSRCYCG